MFKSDNSKGLVFYLHGNVGSLKRWGKVAKTYTDLMIGEGMQKITPFIMFMGEQSGKAEEAINFYVSLFPDSGIIHLERYESTQGEIEETIKYAIFSLNELEFLAMDSIKEHLFTFNPGLSMVVNCESQEELDHLWDKLTEGGDERAQQCG